MQTDIKIRCCKTHPKKEINGFCEECKEFFCRECMEDHIGHTMTKLKDFCEKRRKDVLGQITTSDLSTQLKAKGEEMIKTREKLQKDQRYAKGEIRTKENIAKNKEKNFSQEVERLETVTKCLLGLGEEALTVALRNACEESLKNFDIEEEIRKEFETLESSLRDAKKKVRELEKELGKLSEEINTFDYFKGDEKYELDDERWTAFLILNEKTPLFKPTKQKTDTVYKPHYYYGNHQFSYGRPSTQRHKSYLMHNLYMESTRSTSSGYCINTSVDKFKAFLSVEKVFDIEGVVEKELVDVGQGVKMTEPVKVEKKLIMGYSIYASLSHNGIVAICVNNNTIQLTDLNTNKQVKMKSEKKSLIGFYDSMLLLLTRGKHLREARVEEVFNNPKIKTFKEIEGTRNVNPDTDVSLLHERRKLYYRTINGKLFSFNVDTRANVKIDVGRKVWRLASLNGIDCGIKAVFQDWDDKYTYTLNNDNSITKVNGEQYSPLRTLFPTTSDPKNIKNAVFKYGSCIMRDGKKIDTSHVIDFGWYYSVIRVYRDIFLAYDRKTWSWVLIRIVVP